MSGSERLAWLPPPEFINIVGRGSSCQVSLWETWPLLICLWLEPSHGSFKHSCPFHVKYHGGPPKPMPDCSFYLFCLPIYSAFSSSQLLSSRPTDLWLLMPASSSDWFGGLDSFSELQGSPASPTPRTSPPPTPVPLLDSPFLPPGEIQTLPLLIP